MADYDPTRLRVATGFDVHPFTIGRKLMLGGIEIVHDRGLEGHSDADVVAHAVTDAVLGSAGLDDIGEYFPEDDPKFKDADSMQLLAAVAEDVVVQGMQLVNVDVIVMCQAPRIAPYRERIRANLAQALALDEGRVTVRATTTDRLGFIGRGEGAAALATCLALRVA